VAVCETTVVVWLPCCYVTRYNFRGTGLFGAGEGVLRPASECTRERLQSVSLGKLGGSLPICTDLCLNTSKRDRCHRQSLHPFCSYPVTERVYKRYTFGERYVASMRLLATEMTAENGQRLVRYGRPYYRWAISLSGISFAKHRLLTFLLFVYILHFLALLIRAVPYCNGSAMDANSNIQRR
jgi:hypothetical protein